jgi:hypothetical protein
VNATERLVAGPLRTKRAVSGRGAAVTVANVAVLAVDVVRLARLADLWAAHAARKAVATVARNDRRVTCMGTNLRHPR